VNGAVRTKGWDLETNLGKRQKKVLIRWISNIVEFNGMAIRPIPPSDILADDAAEYGFGGIHLASLEAIQGFWEVKDAKSMSSNLRELKADVKTATHFLEHLDIHDSVIAILSDNSTSSFYINKQGGRVRMLDNITKKFVERCLLKRNVIVRVYHTPGQDIVEMGVDGYSRGKNPPFRLSQDLQEKLRAARQDCRIVFPLFDDIPKVLEEISQTQERILLVTPIFTSQAWWPQVLNTTTCLPIVILKSPHNLIVEESERAHTRRFLVRQGFLAWSVCGARQGTNIFRPSSFNSNSAPRDRIKERFTIVHGQDGSNSAKTTKRIPNKLRSILSGIFQFLNSRRS
jgi:hypothetical protein